MAILVIVLLAAISGIGTMAITFTIQQRFLSLRMQRADLENQLVLERAQNSYLQAEVARLKLEKKRTLQGEEHPENKTSKRRAI